MIDDYSVRIVGTGFSALVGSWVMVDATKRGLGGLAAFLWGLGAFVFFCIGLPAWLLYRPGLPDERPRLKAMKRPRPHWVDVASDKCPACQGPITADTAVCPSCGISFGRARPAAPEPPGGVD